MVDKFQNSLYYELLKLKYKLEKHKDVSEIYYFPARKSTPVHKLNIILQNDFDAEKPIKSIIASIYMIKNLKIDLEDENSDTVGVINALEGVIKYINDTNLKQEIKDSRAGRELLIQVSSMLVVFSVGFKETRRISKLINEDLEVRESGGGNTYYRGHTSSLYKIIPSIYRNLIIEEGFGVINFNRLRNLYSQSGLLDKYCDVFSNKDIDYNFCAFAQHACAYSPLLDFTDDIKVALSFATKVTSINDYSTKDAAIYSIFFNDDLKTAEEVTFSDIDIVVYNGKLTPYTTIRNKYLFECTWRDFEVEAYILSDKTNDRMKYQRGCFLYFKKAIIVNGTLLLPVNFARMRKYTIPYAGKTINKQNISKKIEQSFKWYQYEYLMNPYKYFEEAPL